MLLMLGVGFYAMRFNRGAADYFKGGNRIHWLAAGLSSFMSGFSAWTFTGAAGLAYRNGVVAVLLYVGNACTFLLGYFIFAARWRRARIATVMEYLTERYDERTRQAFSWTTIFFQFFIGASMLYGLGLFVAPICGWPLSWTIFGSGLVILAYCVVGGLWAVVITDFLQAAILVPFTFVMVFVSLARTGGLASLVAALPPDMTTLSLTPQFGWVYVACWTVMTSFGYNTAAMAQRYFSVEDERASRKIALLCFALFLLGAFTWFVPPFAMRVLHPDLAAIWPGLANPHESSYALAALTLLPTGLVGIMLAAMFSATMSSISGLLNVHASIISKDIFPTLFPRRAGDSERLAVAWIATFGVGAVMISVAMVMAAAGQSVFQVMLTFNTIMSLAYGPPALLGLVVRRTPAWSGLAAFAVALLLGCVFSFALGWGLIANVLIIVPTSVAVFFLTGLFEGRDAGHATRRDGFFRRLDTPVDAGMELPPGPDPTREVFRFLSLTIAGVGLLSLALIFEAAPAERTTVLVYVAFTLILAGGLSGVRGRAAGTALCMLLLAPAGTAHAGVARLWAVHDGEKVALDDLDHPSKARNTVWDGKRVRLFGARNEVVAFQVIVEADTKGIGALSITLPELRQRGGESRIRYAPPAADPTVYAGRPIQIFSVRSMRVTEESRASWVWEPGSAAAPRRTTGWQPVQLVPENARAGRGGLPVEVEPSRNQALWIEIYTGRERPAGTYEGTIRVKADASALTLPVELRVFDFALPDANSLPAMVYFEPDQPELYQGRNLDPAYHRLAHRHRIELVNAYDEASVLAHLGRFDGSDFIEEAGYEGPGQGTGNIIAPVSFYGVGPEFEQRDSAWKRSDAWMQFVRKTLPRSLTFLYLPDEPYPPQYPEVLRIAENVKSNPGPGGALPTFLTKSIVPELQGPIDIWCVPPQGLDLKAAAAERARGRRVWTYNGGRPQGPSPLIDAPATEARAIPWASFKHGLDLYFFWHGVHWQHNRQKQGERRQNVWANPITFDNRGQPNKPVEDQGFINGDGVLMYPGEEVLHPEEDRGIAGPISTVQLANLRRGLQDHLYLTLAREKGREALVQETLRAVVPRVFSDAGDTVGFAETGDAYEAARLQLAEALGAAAGKPTLQERLGHKKDAKLLIVHADDLGEWHAVNEAAIRLIDAGVVSSAVAMPPCPWFPEIAAWAKAHPQFALGLHLTVTSERTDYRWGPVSREPVPSLLDAAGYFRKIQAEAIQAIDAADAEREIRAQVERARALGMQPTHLDSHQGVLYQREDVFQALVRVSRSSGIPIGLARSEWRRHPFMASALGEDALVIDRAFDIPPGIPAESWGEWYEDEIRRIGPGVTQLVMHPGLADVELRAATRDRPTWGANWRQRDYDFFSSERFRTLLRETGLRLVTWREITALKAPSTRTP